MIHKWFDQFFKAFSAFFASIRCLASKYKMRKWSWERTEGLICQSVQKWEGPDKRLGAIFWTKMSWKSVSYDCRMCRETKNKLKRRPAISVILCLIYIFFFSFWKFHYFFFCTNIWKSVLLFAFSVIVDQTSKTFVKKRKKKKEIKNWNKKENSFLPLT